MAKSKRAPEVTEAAAPQKETKFTPEALVRSGIFDHLIQKDFLRTILKRPFYTKKEAEAEIAAFLKKE